MEEEPETLLQLAPQTQNKAVIFAIHFALQDTQELHLFAGRIAHLLSLMQACSVRNLPLMEEVQGMYHKLHAKALNRMHVKYGDYFGILRVIQGSRPLVAVLALRFALLE